MYTVILSKDTHAHFTILRGLLFEKKYAFFIDRTI